MRFSLPDKGDGPFNLLCLGAHSDDIEIGCGATLLYLKKIVPRLRFHWVVFSGVGTRGHEALKAAELFTSGCDRVIEIREFRDGFLPYDGLKAKEFFEEIKQTVNPDLIFTHWQGDAHQDHRCVSELTWNTFRNHLILEYEIPKYDGDMGRPTLFVPSDTESYEAKLNYLFQAFDSQRSKRWFQRETFLGLMRLRGMECNSPSGYAEAFHVRKLVLSQGV